MVYKDARNLYGWEISEYVRSDRFQWLIQDETDRLNVNTSQKDI